MMEPIFWRKISQIFLFLLFIFFKNHVNGFNGGCIQTVRKQQLQRFATGLQKLELEKRDVSILHFNSPSRAAAVAGPRPVKRFEDGDNPWNPFLGNARTLAADEKTPQEIISFSMGAGLREQILSEKIGQNTLDSGMQKDWDPFREQPQSPRLAAGATKPKVEEVSYSPIFGTEKIQTKTQHVQVDQSVVKNMENEQTFPSTFNYQPTSVEQPVARNMETEQTSTRSFNLEPKLIEQPAVENLETEKPSFASSFNFNFGKNTRFPQTWIDSLSQEVDQQSVSTLRFANQHTCAKFNDEKPSLQSVKNVQHFSKTRSSTQLKDLTLDSTKNIEKTKQLEAAKGSPQKENNSVIENSPSLAENQVAETTNHHHGYLSNLFDPKSKQISPKFDQVQQQFPSKKPGLGGYMDMIAETEITSIETAVSETLNNNGYLENLSDSEVEVLALKLDPVQKSASNKKIGPGGYMDMIAEVQMNVDAMDSLGSSVSEINLHTESQVNKGTQEIAGYLDHLMDTTSVSLDATDNHLAVTNTEGPGYLNSLGNAVNTVSQTKDKYEESSAESDRHSSSTGVPQVESEVSESNPWQNVFPGLLKKEAAALAK
mmetsp:Transcript_13706/g.18033  ORF Transcript_13706/g.18033 Transcript_13706/m.18033 type:complete len:599 (-) Transcript_13706:504-2300(-)|eukprot:CAMPEP_0117751880 /NCGR_PEP_ID=MMETSP0947-20121206/11252_1 /TAXON_ID=44440 /ORGANISM="Chattonella subsalsa, Strain CCMP2191" /LENGTH=598 /DNA_ID=CAMNT_0005570373 /DNA_START=109 /DNA_END=1905 /DNA_ORIENTATION=+